MWRWKLFNNIKPFLWKLTMKNYPGRKLRLAFPCSQGEKGRPKRAHFSSAASDTQELCTDMGQRQEKARVVRHWWNETNGFNIFMCQKEEGRRTREIELVGTVAMEKTLRKERKRDRKCWQSSDSEFRPSAYKRGKQKIGRHTWVSLRESLNHIAGRLTDWSP